MERPPPGDIMADWRRAQATDTPEAYREFLRRHPGSPFTTLVEAILAETEAAGHPAEARSELTGNATADWRRVQATDTPEAYREFLRRHPGSPFTTLAEAILAELD